MSKKSKNKKQHAHQSPQPRWQPISMLPTLGPHITGMLEAAEEQYVNLQQARPKPYVLDDFTVNRVIEVFGKQKKDLPLFDEQLSRWRVLPLTENERLELEHLATQMARLHEVIDAILTLADELKQGTIEKVMSKSNEELGLEFLLRMMEGKGRR